MKIKFAFTLAEVLITLVIIGVVAALTIPTAINNMEKRHNIVAWRKMYSDFSRALLLAKANNEVLDNVSSISLGNVLSKYISLKPCSYSYNVKGSGSTDWKQYSEDHNYFCADLENGSRIQISAIIVGFDVNGGRKLNKVGKDVFFAIIDRTNYKLNPAIGFKDTWGAADGILVTPNRGNGTCQTADYGYGCSSWYLLHDK